MTAVLGITEATLPWIILLTAILVGSAGGLAFLAVTARDTWREWRWQQGATYEELLGTVPGAWELVDDAESSEHTPGSDGVWFTDMLKELE